MRAQLGLLVPRNLHMTSCVSSWNVDRHSATAHADAPHCHRDLCTEKACAPQFLHVASEPMLLSLQKLLRHSSSWQACKHVDEAAILNEPEVAAQLLEFCTEKTPVASSRDLRDDFSASATSRVGAWSPPQKNSRNVDFRGIWGGGITRLPPCVVLNLLLKNAQSGL